MKISIKREQNGIYSGYAECKKFDLKSKQTKYIHSSKINAVLQTDFHRWGLVAIFAVATSLVGCVKDELYDTPHPDKAAVVITTDWVDALDETDVPAAYNIGMDGDEAAKTQEATTVYPGLLAPGKHSVFVYNEPQGMTISGTTASVKRLSDGTLEPMPDYLFSATTEFEAPADDTVHVAVPMVRRLCPITLNLSLEDGNTEDIASITATLGGMAASVDLRTGMTGRENATVTLDIKQQAKTKARAYTEGRLEMRCRVVGINSQERQVLTVKVVMADGHVQDIESDLSDRLKDLNTGMEPIELTGMVEAPQDGHFSGSITDWTDVTGDPVEAN